MALKEIDKVYSEICDVLGLKHVRRLDFHMAVHNLFTVTVEFFPEIDGILQFPAILKKYKLEEIEEEDLVEIGSEINQIINLDSKIDKDHPTSPLFEDEEPEN